MAQIDQKSASSLAITLNLITAGFGTGLLTMPWGVAGSSMLMSLVILFVVFALNAWVVHILVTASAKCKTYELGLLMARLPYNLGAVLQVCGNATVWFSQILVLIGYTIIIVSGLHRYLAALGIVVSRLVLTAVVAAIAYPLSLLDQQRLAWTSSISIAANIYIGGLVFCYATPYMRLEAIADAQPDSDLSLPTHRHLCIWGVSPGAITNFSLQMFALNILMMILPMYNELDRRSPERFMRCLLTSYVFLYLVFAVVMVCGYMAFGPYVESNLLDAMPDDAWAQAARFAMVLCLLGCYPLNVKPMIAPFLQQHDGSVPEPGPREPLLGVGPDAKALLKPEAPTTATRNRNDIVEQIVTLLVILGVSCVSVFLRQLGPLNAFNGALQMTAFVGIIPCSLGLFLLGKELTPCQRWIHRIALGLLFALAMFFATLSFGNLQNEPRALEAACTWHLDLEL